MTESGALAAAAAAVIRRHAAALGAPSGSGLSADAHRYGRLLADIASGLEAPPRVRIVGGPGAGRGRLAAALESSLDVRCEVVDANGQLPGSVPDVEVFAWCTAPCRHELQWLRRPRRHPAVMVATRADTWAGGDRPAWAEGLVAVGECVAGSPGFDRALGLVEEATADVSALRLAVATLRLDRDCDGLGARDVAEALCAELSTLAHGAPLAGKVAS